MTDVGLKITLSLLYSDGSEAWNQSEIAETSALKVPTWPFLIRNHRQRRSGKRKNGAEICIEDSSPKQATAPHGSTGTVIVGNINMSSSADAAALETGSKGRDAHEVQHAVSAPVVPLAQLHIWLMAGEDYLRKQMHEMNNNEQRVHTAMEASGISHEEAMLRVELGSLRVTHRQRFSKAMHFVGLRCVDGYTAEAVCKADFMKITQVNSCYRLGDVVRVVGILEVRGNRLSVRAEQLQVEEAWIDVFGKATFLFDWDAANANPPERWALGSALLLQAAAAQSERLLARMAESAIEVLGVVRPVAQVRHTECGVVLRASDAVALTRAIGADELLLRVVQRVYLLEQRCATLSAALDALGASLRQPRAQAGAPNAAPLEPADASGVASEADAPQRAQQVVRCAAFPRTLEKRATDTLHERGFLVRPSNYDALACLVYMHGFYCVGVATKEDFGGALWEKPRTASDRAEGPSEQKRARAVHGSQQLSEDGGGAAVEAAAHNDSAATRMRQTSAPVCRAYYKLKELGSRELVAFSDCSVAIDVGASPGGWTSYLAERGCSKIIAIDPAELRQTEPPPPCVEHLRQKLQDALPGLLQRKGLAADLYCCDMNAAPSLVVELFTQAVPLLKPGAQVVLTFKNVYPKKRVWEAERDAQLDRLRSVADDVHLVQLFANTPRECTVLCRAKQSTEQ